ncbi:alcohol dehydrogenase catalytic domain-containing protein [Candidatus Nitrosocosmicus franklandus]|uniref:Sorbitol dehydrogenase n=1 Tax=Candidatus Nitrosocosmicus franklandianus TaxID=1798806 RepID=A0A484IGS6_9ARCH|nr:alcohol dehydrogenase catalytic domain-containing protein [Candidatus Nitrosocosmicus franklandus]VFJ15410.1 Sorbitol dehydrogenase [Candidatus Nitrosocosmicus franklandus]
MKAAVLEKSKVVVKDINLPKIGKKEILIRMKACGICGSDLEKVFGRYGMKSSRIGHEPVGQVMKVGREISNFKKGDRVFVHHHVPCYSCRFCYSGDYTMCDIYQKSNIEPCGLSEFILVPELNVVKGGVVKIPDGITYEHAALIEPVACCLRSLDKIDIKKSDSISIFGAGPTGLMHLILLKCSGVSKIIVVDVNDFRLDFAKRIDPNITTIDVGAMDDEHFQKKMESIVGKDGVDKSIICTSSKSAFINSLEITRRGGTISLFGVPPKDKGYDIDLNKIYSKELKIIPSYATSEKEIHQVIRLMENDIINLEPLITHKFSLAESEKAFLCAHKGNDSMKIIITTE